MSSFSSEIPVAATVAATAASTSLIDSMFDLDEAFDLPPYFSTDSLVEEAPESKQKSDPEPLSVSTLPVVAAGIGGAAGVCSVCMESFGHGSGGRQIPCGHVYHDGCIARWVAVYDSCPLCRCKVSSS